MAETASGEGTKAVPTHRRYLNTADLGTGIINRYEKRRVVIQLDNGSFGFVPVGLVAAKPTDSAGYVLEIGQRVGAGVADIGKGRTRWKVILDLAAPIWEQFVADCWPGIPPEAEVVSNPKCKDGMISLLTVSSVPSSGVIAGVTFPKRLADQNPVAGDTLAVKVVRACSQHRRTTFYMLILQD